MAWAVEMSTDHAFVTTDRPVAMWKRDTRDLTMMGTGLENSDEVRFPLLPGETSSDATTGRMTCRIRAELGAWLSIWPGQAEYGWPFTRRLLFRLSYTGRGLGAW